MDLNHLYFRHQLLLIRADEALSAAARRAHEGAASRIACRIGSVQRGLGAASAPAWEALCGGRSAALASGWPS